MASNYPGSLDAFVNTHVAGEVIASSTDNDQADAINKIEAELGIHPSGAASNVVTRLNNIDAALTDIGIDITDLGTSLTTEINLVKGWADELGITFGGLVRRGKSIIATEETRTNTAYGFMTTPDRVSSVVLPTDGLIVVAYQALWKESVIGAARAALFLGANQVKLQVSPSPVAVETSAMSGTADQYRSLTSSLASGIAATTSTGYSSDVTTGQFIGGPAGSGQGLVHIFAAAGTYDVSVQTKSTSGSVTMKERKLWVRTEGY